MCNFLVSSFKGKWFDKCHLELESNLMLLLFVQD